MTIEIESAWAKYPDHRIDLEPCRGAGEAWAGTVGFLKEKLE